MKLSVPKETRDQEKRVSVTPDVIRRLIQQGLSVTVEAGAGMSVGHTDADYLAVGASIAPTQSELYSQANIVAWVKRPAESQQQRVISQLPQGAIAVGFMDPFKPGNHVALFAERELATVAFELLPIGPATEQMDALGAMSRITGDIVVAEAMQANSFPRPHKLLVVGAGNAGMAAVERAYVGGIAAVVASTSEKMRGKVESQFGGRFWLLPSEAGGRLNPTQQLAAQQSVIAALLAEERPTIIVTCARRRGQKSPLLFTAEMIQSLEPGTQIVDLVASVGGNTAYTKVNHTENVSGVTISNRANYPSCRPQESCGAYARAMYHLLRYITEKKAEDRSYQLCREDPVLGESLLTVGGTIHPLVRRQGSD